LIFPPGMSVFVASAYPWTPATHEGTTGRFAGRDGRVCVGEGDAHCGKTINIRGLGL